jgi:CheY-like chemotaxis protein
MNTPLKIFLIEDDAIEVLKFTRAIAKLEDNCTFIDANNGEEAIKILNKKDYLPDIILLDLQMPKINGLEFLDYLKTDSIFKYLPVIILTTSKNQKDILSCYEKGIAGYVLKPLKYNDYILKIKGLLNYWSSNELIRK